MKKEIVIAKLKEYAGRPIEVGLADEGALMHGGIEGHWLFVSGDNLVEIKKNTADGTFGFSTVNQKESPFTITTVNFDTVNYIRAHFGGKPNDVENFTKGLEPIGTTKSLDEVKKEIETDSIRAACSPKGYVNNKNAGYDTSYGYFKGTAVSTDINGFEEHLK